MRWERITSVFGNRMVYWRRRLPDGGWLAVQKFSSWWVWRRYAKSSRLLASGEESSISDARSAADAVAARENAWTAHRKMYHMGVFADIEEAAAVRFAAEQKYWGDEQ